MRESSKVHLILWSNQWVIYAILLVPNCASFLYIKCRKSHSFFHPVHLNLTSCLAGWELGRSLGGRGPLDSTAR